MTSYFELANLKQCICQLKQTWNKYIESGKTKHFCEILKIITIYNSKKSLAVPNKKAAGNEAELKTL